MIKGYQLRDKCRYCGATDNLTLDHKHPKILGGTDAKKNLQTLCLTCNMLKSDIPDKRFKQIMEHGIYCFLSKKAPVKQQLNKSSKGE